MHLRPTSALIRDALRASRMSIVEDVCTDESGASALEYGLLVAVIALSQVALLQSIGVSVSGFYDMVVNAF